MEIQLVITLGPNGFNVSGPIDNVIQTLGMLEAAKVSVIEHAKAKEQRVQVAPAGLVIPKA